MEKKKVITNTINENLIISKHLLFEWKVEEKQTKGKKVTFVFSRDKQKPYHEELVKLEKEFGNYKIWPMFPSYILSGLAFLLITIFFVFYMIDKANMLIYFLSFTLPGLILLLAASIYTMFHFFNLRKIEKEFTEKTNKYKEKINELKNKY